MKIQKITAGFVIQEFDTESGRCVGQSFLEGTDIQYEDEHGDSLVWTEADWADHPFDMVQPKI